jgi:hypothetical protein
VRDDIGDVRDRAAQLSARDHRLDRVPEKLQRDFRAPRRGLEHDPDRGGQFPGVAADPWIPPGLLVAGLALRAGQQLGGHQHVEQLHRVVGGPGLQHHDRGQQGRQPAGAGVAAQRRRLAGHAVAGQLNHPPPRDRTDLDLADADRDELADPVQRRSHRAARHAGRAAA